MTLHRVGVWAVAVGVWLAAGRPYYDHAIPVRGLHVLAPHPDEIPLALRFIREALPREGVNVLVLEVNYHYRFASRPEVAESDALSRDEIRKIVEACRAAKIELIPEINLLGHQSWNNVPGGLLKAHPEFDEAPGRDLKGQTVVTQSYCPRHPKVHEVVFDLIDELADACQARTVHAGMDEVFLIGENECPRCRGANKAELFAAEVRTLREHLAKSGRAMWIWGDRFLDDSTGGIVQNLNANANTTQAALRMIPKDVVICDWQYYEPTRTARFFAEEGFPVVLSFWKNGNLALWQLDSVRHVRRNASPAVSERMLGMMHTSWSPFGDFVRAYFRNGSGNTPADWEVRSFRKLFRELR